MHHPIPLSVIRDLKCRHCGKFVTCGPVHVVPDGGILCGRCRILAKPHYRNYAFEAIASTYYYPCTFWSKNCPQRLLWNQSIDHERGCIYQSTCKLLCSKPGALCRGDRKLPEDEGINLEHVTEETLENLKCVACESYLSCDPVYIGVDGRNVCHRCVTSNGVPKGCIRNLAYERMASTMIFPCIYRFRGCTIRLRYSREMWQHESECSYGQIYKKVVKKPSKNGKERGVIQTHSGHYYGTITPHSALFSPPMTSSNEGKILTQELAIMMRKKQEDGNKTPEFSREQSIDSQSMDSMMDNSRTSSLTRRPTPDLLDGYSSQDNISRTSSRPPTREERSSMSLHNYSEEVRRPSDDSMLSSDTHLDVARASVNRKISDDSILNVYPEEIVPSPTPAGFNKLNPYGYYPDNVARYGGRPINYDHFSHFPPLYVNEQLKYSPSFQYPPRQDGVAVKRSESLRVGNKDIIDELKVRQRLNNGAKKDEANPYGQCANLQDIVQLHDQVFHD